MKYDDIELMSERNSAFLLHFPLSMHAIFFLVIACIILGLLWSAITQVDEVVVGNGKVIPSSNVQVIQSLEGGIVKEVRVKEGQIVEKNDILMVIDDTMFASNFGQNQVERAGLEAKIARLNAQINRKPIQFSESFESQFPEFTRSEKELYDAAEKSLELRLSILQNNRRQKTQELKETESRVKQLESSFAFADKELNLTRPLVAQGAVSEVEVLRLRRTVNDLKGDLQAQKLAMPRIQEAIANIDQEINEETQKYIEKSLSDLKDAKVALRKYSEAGKSLQDQVDRTHLRSPVKGTVNRITVTTVGGIVQPGEDVMEVVPLEDSLLIEAKLKPKDIAYLAPGLNAKVKITAYDFSIYGTLAGQLEHISADTIQDEKGEQFYYIRVRTADSELHDKAGNALPIIPGMTATVDLVTGKKTILSYLLKPIKKAQYNAFRER